MLSLTKPELAWVKVDCRCQRHTKRPLLSDNFSFAGAPENVGHLKQWILDKYVSSIFKKCPHQRLPMMEAKPLKLDRNPKTAPTAVYTATTAPLHWEDDAARMHIVPNHKKTPRWAVDLWPLNKNCKQKSQYSVLQSKQAVSVSSDQWKRVIGAWNGNQSEPLAGEDRHLTSFMTKLS